MTGKAVQSVVQIGLVVVDAKETALQYRQLLGVEDWFINEVDTQAGRGRRFHNRDQQVTARARIAWARLGEVELELIEPLDENSVYAQFLREQGPGLHHVMFGGVDLRTSSRQMAAAGIVELAGGEIQQTRFKLFDTRDALGLICEFAEGGELAPDGRI
jgi:4-hydroxyphenylpyruvate dioxygenase-like putative hemolysin